MALLLWLLGGLFALLVVGGVLAYTFGVYNRLVRVDERCENAWSDIQVVLKQRRDELDKLVDTVQQTMDYERDVLQDVVEAREAASNASTPAEAARADEQVRSALEGLSVRAEDHPDLSAPENLRQLQDKIATLEEQIADRREHYNEAVTTYNTLIRQIPYVLFAGSMGFEQRELFEAPEAEKADVDVSEMFAETDGDSPGAEV